MKHYTKYLLAALILAAIVLTTIISSALAAPTQTNTSGAVAITADQVETEPGGIVKIKLTMTENPGITGLLLKVSYDSANLTLTKVEDGGLLGANSHKDALTQPYTLCWVNDTATTNFTQTGVIASLTFQVSDEAQGKDYPITMSYTPNNYDIVDKDLNQYGAVFTQGNIKVTLPTIAVQGIKVENPEMNVQLGAYGGIGVAFIPANATNQALTFESSDSSIVSVDADGQVYGEKLGEATITVKSVEGGYTDTCHVTVTCPHLQVTTYVYVASTCTQPGHNEYSVCAACGKVVNGSDAPLPLAPHTGGTATCTQKAVCEVCNQPYGDVDPSNHTAAHTIEAVASTCTTHGHAAYEYCDACGKVVSGSDAELPFEPHHGGVATCVSKAVCTTCGQEYGEFDMNNHGTPIIVLAEESTCTKHGHGDYSVCERCGAVLSGSDAELPLKAHVGGEATCNKKAVCTVCGQEYGELDPSNHKNTHVVEATESTCAVAGHAAYTVCDDCGAVVAGSDAALPLKEHVGGEATCNKKAVCTACGQEYGEFDADNHKNTRVVEATESTCAVAGHAEYTVCDDCGKVLSGSDAALPLKDHVGGTATCCKKAVCTACGQEYGEFDPENHDGEQEIRNAKDATCAEPGYTGDLVCTGCNGILRAGEEIPALGHTTETKDKKDATCTEDGYTGDEVCVVCGEVVRRGEVISKTGHTDEDGDGVCDVCGQSIEVRPPQTGDAGIFGAIIAAIIAIAAAICIAIRRKRANALD